MCVCVYFYESVNRLSDDYTKVPTTLTPRSRTAGTLRIYRARFLYPRPFSNGSPKNVRMPCARFADPVTRRTSLLLLIRERNKGLGRVPRASVPSDREKDPARRWYDIHYLLFTLRQVEIMTSRNNRSGPKRRHSVINRRRRTDRHGNDEKQTKTNKNKKQKKLTLEIITSAFQT